MYQRSASHVWRERVVLVTLTGLLGAGVFFFLLMIGGPFFLSLLLTLAVLGAVAGVHYLAWGQNLENYWENHRRFPNPWARRQGLTDFESKREDHAYRWPTVNGSPREWLDKSR